MRFAISLVDRCSSLDELLSPLRIHLAPRLSDALVLSLIGLAAKRIESAIRRVRANNSVAT